LFIDCFAHGFNIVQPWIKNPTIISARDGNNCQNACKKDSKCNYWSFDVVNEKCRFIEYIYPSMNLVKETNFQIGARDCMPIEDVLEASKKLTCAKEGYFTKTKAEQTPHKITTPNFFLCQQICYMPPEYMECRFWTYNAKDYSCTLYHIPGSTYWKSYDLNIYGFKSK